MRGIYWYLFILAFIIQKVQQPCYAQNIACPEVVWTTPNPIALSCDLADSCFTLEAKLPDIRRSVDGPDAYSVTNIPFATLAPYWPVPPSATPVLVNIDDRFSSVINLPFPFCYYGVTYNQMVVGSNGRISFDTQLAGSYDEWSFSSGIPSIFTPFTRATIYGLYHDIDPSESSSQKSIHWEVIDQAPCRKMVITYSDMPHYSCTDITSSFQIVLYENTNAIEVYVRNKPLCSSWNGGASIIGIQNWSGTHATTAPGMNINVNSTLTNTAYRFTPNGPSLLDGDIELLDINNNVIQTISNPVGNNGEINVSFDNVCFDQNGPAQQMYKVRALFNACSGQDIEVEDILTVVRPDLVPVPIVTTPILYCVNDTPSPLTATSLPGHTLSWYDTNQNLLPGAPTPDVSMVGTQTYYVAQENQVCESVKTPIVVEVSEDVVNNYNVTICRSRLPLDTLGVIIPINIQSTDLINSWVFPLVPCDSISNYFIEVIENDTTVIADEVCEAVLPIDFYGQILTSTGIYFHVFQGNWGCDSIIQYELQVNLDNSSTEELEFCMGDLPQVWNGITIPVGSQSQVGYASVVFPNIAGCDSTVTLDLVVNDEWWLEEEIVMCSSELPFTWHQHVFDSNTLAGVYNITADYVSASGCDSIHSLSLTIHPEYKNIVSESICESSLPFTWHNLTWDASTAPGTYLDTVHYASVNQCDSVFYLELIVLGDDHSVVQMNICTGDLPQVWNGITIPVGSQSQVGYASVVFPNIAGCDSTVTLDLVVNDEWLLEEEIVMCSSELPFTWHQHVFDSNTLAGVYDVTADYVSASGCDSIHSLSLTIHPEYENIVSESICESSLPFTWHNLIWDASTAPGTYLDTVHYASVNQCDSVFYLELIVLGEDHSVVQMNICTGDLPQVWNGITIPVGSQSQVGYASVVFPNIAGCDSTVTLDLVVNDEWLLEEEIVMCSSELPFTWHQHVFDSNTLAGVYDVTADYVSASGCDSIHSLSLTIHPEYETTLDTIVCFETLPFTWHGAQITQENYQNNLSVNYYTENGCDSIMNLIVYVYPESQNQMIELEGCGQVIFEGQTYSASINYQDTLLSISGCDSLTRNIQITVYPEYNETIFNIFEGCDSIFYDGKMYYESTTFQDTLFTINGCDSAIVETELVVHHFEVDVSSDFQEIYITEPVTLYTHGTSTYEVIAWTPSSLFSNQSALHQQNIFLNQTEWIEVTAKSMDGCFDTASILIEVLPLDKNVMVPNAFTPNGDGLNDEFGPELPIDRGYVIEEFSIYNRYGQRVFFNSGQYNKKWNGTFNGIAVDMGTYIWVLKIRFADGDRLDAKGDVHLLR